jgi:hypothetical protein
MRFDMRLVKDIEKVPLDNFKVMRADVLLMGGSKSPKYLRLALDALAHLLPHAKRIEFR